MRKLAMPVPALKAVLEHCLEAIRQAKERVERLEELLSVEVVNWRLYSAVQVLMTLRGFQRVAASVLVAELGMFFYSRREVAKVRDRAAGPCMTTLEAVGAVLATNPSGDARA